MGKKHAQPEPIDIFNAPSPRTMLKGGTKRPRGESAATVTGPSPTTSASASDFPVAPPAAFDDDDISESESSLNTSEFSSDGDDGNANDDSEESEEDEEDMDDEEGSDDDDDDGGESTDAKDVTVHFTANEMKEVDIDCITHLMDQFLPDHMNEVDRDDFGAALLRSPYTTVVKLSNGEESDDDDEDEAKEVYGIISLLDVASGFEGNHKQSFGPLVSILKKDVWQIVAPGIAPHEMLISKSPEGKSKAVLLMSEYIRNVPLELTSRLFEFTATEFEQVSRKQKKLEGSKNINAIFPCMFVVFAKVQRDTEIAAEQRKRGVKPPKKSARSEANLSFKLEEFIFWRHEDNILYDMRDTRVAVHAYRCRSQYDNQPESERPVTLCFALSFEGLLNAITAVKKCETIKPLK